MAYREYYSEPVVPYETTSIWEWGKEHTIDVDEYPALTSHFGERFDIAVLRSPELTAELNLRQEIETVIMTEGVTRVEHPHLKPEYWGTRPKLYRAPEGMAFEMLVRVDFDEFDEDETGYRLPPTRTEWKTTTGEYLDIATNTEKGKSKASIFVTDWPNAHAWPIYNDGNPEHTEVVRLPSRADPSQPGAALLFARFDDWEVVNEELQGLKADHTKVGIRLVPFEKEASTELYVADFQTENKNTFALDDFIFVDEQPILPPGYFLPPLSGDVRQATYNPIQLLTLPPMPDRYLWGHLWEKHGIMLKVNPTIHNFGWGDSRFFHLHFDQGNSRLHFDIRKFNTLEERFGMFMRAMAIVGIANTSMEDVMKVALSKDQLEGDDREKFGRHF